MSNSDPQSAPVDEARREKTAVRVVRGEAQAPVAEQPIEHALRAVPTRETAAYLSALAQPDPSSRSSFRMFALFVFSFAVPVAAAAFYLFAFASDRYASEASFIVRSASGDQGAGGLQSLIQTKGTTRATDETFAVIQYLSSRDVIELLLKNNNLRDILSRPEADAINRFPNFYSRDNNEQLYRRYQSMVDVKMDSGTGITTIEVNAFRPDDAKAVVTALLGYAEAMVNRLNERAYQDALVTANSFVDLAMAQTLDSEKKLSDYRSKTGVVDPVSETAAAFKTIGQLSDQLAQIEAQIIQSQKLSPLSPSIGPLRDQAHAYRDEIERQRQRLSGASDSLSSKLAQFEQLVLERELAAKSLELASLSRDSARDDAERQHLYVQTVTEPNFPDIAKYPRRLLWMLGIVTGAGLVFFVLRGMMKSALEHRP